MEASCPARWVSIRAIDKGLLHGIPTYVTTTTGTSAVEIQMKTKRRRLGSQMHSLSDSDLLQSYALVRKLVEECMLGCWGRWGSQSAAQPQRQRGRITQHAEGFRAGIQGNETRQPLHPERHLAATARSAGKDHARPSGNQIPGREVMSLLGRPTQQNPARNKLRRRGLCTYIERAYG